MKKDDIDEGNIVVALKLHGVFQDGGDTLKNIINKDVVTSEIQECVKSCNLPRASNTLSKWTGQEHEPPRPMTHHSYTLLQNS